MNWFSLIPLLAKIPGPYKAVTVLLVALALASAGFWAGFTVADWRAGAARTGLVAEHGEALLKAEKEKAEAVAKLQAYIDDLEDAIDINNRAIAVAAAQTQAAEAARAQAQKHAAELAALSRNRMDRLQAAFESAKGCTDVLQAYWGVQ